MSNADIAGFADRVNNLLDEKAAISSDVRDVYDEAKEQGVNVKALRKVIAKRRAKTPDPTVVSAMEAYEHALDEAALMVSKGASLRKAATATGASKSAIHRRQVSRRNENASSGTPHDPNTGEITETAAGDRLGEESPATEGPGSSLSSIQEREREAQEETDDGKDQDNYGNGEENPLRGQPHPEDVGGYSLGDREDRDRGDDDREDGGRLRGVGEAQDQLASIQEREGEGCDGGASTSPQLDTLSREAIRPEDLPGSSQGTSRAAPSDSHSTGDDGLELPERLRRVRV